MLQLDVGSTAIATSFGKGTIDPLAMSSVSSAYSHISSCVAGWGVGDTDNDTPLQNRGVVVPRWREDGGELVAVKSWIYGRD